MKKIMLSLFALFVATAAHAADQRAPLPAAQCAQHVPYGQPVVTKPDAALICRQGYFLYHDNAAKIPAWVAWNITPEHVNGCVARTDAFATDASLPAGKSATPADYAASGYDKGHLANDAHQSWDLQVEKESFLMTNMSPQLPGLNRGIWKLLETATGAWTFSRQHTLIIYAGNIYDVTKDKKIGAGVDVPSYLYKIVIDKNTNEVLAFLFPHKEAQGNDLSVVQVTVADIEKASGITFPLPAGASKTTKAALWPVDFKAVADNKKAVCKGS
jgi:endonuclease G, mitochondrial